MTDSESNPAAAHSNAAPPSDARPPEWTPWGLWATVGFGVVVFVVFLVLQALAIIPFLADFTGDSNAVGQVVETNAEYFSTAAIVSGFGCTVLILLVVRLRKGASIRDYLALRRPRWGVLLTWIAVAAVVVVMLDVVTVLLDREVVPEWWRDVHANAKAPLLLAFASVVAAPLFEEFFFRGFLFQGLVRSKLGATGTILVTSALWAAVHSQYGAYEIVQIFILGLVLGIARHRSDSLVVPLAIHAAINLGATIQVLVLS